MICAFLLVGLVGVILGTALQGETKNVSTWVRTLMVLFVMLAITITIISADLYIMQLKTRSDLLAYINECNEKYQNQPAGTR